MRSPSRLGFAGGGTQQRPCVTNQPRPPPSGPAPAWGMRCRPDDRGGTQWRAAARPGRIAKRGVTISLSFSLRSAIRRKPPAGGCPGVSPRCLGAMRLGRGCVAAAARSWARGTPAAGAPGAGRCPAVDPLAAGDPPRARPPWPAAGGFGPCRAGRGGGEEGSTLGGFAGR